MPSLVPPQRPKVIVLTRPGSASKSGDLSVVPVDHTDFAGLTKVLKDHSIDVVISKFPEEGFEVQYTFLAASVKASGTVKLFVPYECSMPTEGAKVKEESNRFSEKDRFAEYLGSIELPFARLYVSVFPSFVLGADVSENVNILGKGETPLNATSDADIASKSIPRSYLNSARFTCQFRSTLSRLAHVLTSLSLDSPYLVNESQID
ncbi:hypothetical protein GYMLUDRAFT_249921 [Collybiopsis luxurians FD-317 M1]|uniref:NmrA-like domain-containing protein n=1 Tax=Collybiopsis luxurians FD-317 M1 TaxID=944289 RepID=A0A0D0BH30_9AGAR|nr:hypothetical protein GYMLUDRAFT_249921 [Collybiopsis luxurians FD-317 M1]